jgi:glycosyltransferase involved in cell wall biosynthesis
MTAGPAGGALKRIAIVGPSGRAIARLRGSLIRDLTLRHHQVLALAPQMRAEDVQGLTGLGASAQSFALKPEGFALFPGRAAIKLLAARVADWQPHTVLAFGPGAAFAINAARRAGVEAIVLMVNEMPGRTLPSSLSRAAGYARAIVLHNREDAVALAADGLIRNGRSIAVVPGAGADLAAMAEVAPPSGGLPLTFLMAARLDGVKGVREFCEAARALKNEGAAAHFILAGPEGTGEDAIKADELSGFAGIVELLGDQPDLRTALSRAHVFVSPSHREGMPHAVQQALAAGRPVIVSDIAGARETADEFVNGIIVPPRDAKALAEAFRRMVRHRDQLAAMGRASRLKAERLFDSAAVNARLRGILGVS